MVTHKIVLKFFVEDPGALGEGEFVPVFHGWIQRQAVEDHLLIDVADYGHVHHGPGTVLVAHEANFSTDRAAGRLGLVYSRKQPLSGDTAERLRYLFAVALKACATLEREPSLAGRMKFRTDEMLFRLNDRLLAPNTEETFAAVNPSLRNFLSELYLDASVTLSHQPSPLTLFEVLIKVSASPSVTALLDRLGAQVSLPPRP